MDNQKKLNADTAYHPEKFDKNTRLLEKKPQDQFLVEDDITLITMDNVKKLDQWEKEQKKARS